MFRRHFMQRITLTGAGGLAVIGTSEARANSTVTYGIKGFSCATCAVGLETMLQQQRGVARARASYPEAKVVIEFDSKSVTCNGLKEFVTEQGFTVEEEKKV